MVTIKNKQQEWVITEKEYYKDKAKWNARGEVTFDVKEPILDNPKFKEIHKEISECFDNPTLKVDPEVLQTEAEQIEIIKKEVKSLKKDAKKKSTQNK